MTFEAFLAGTLDWVNAHLPADLLADAKKIEKNNGTVYTGICLACGSGVSASPLLYMEQIYREQYTEADIPSIGARIVKTLLTPIPKYLSVVFRDYEDVRERIVYRLVGRSGNEQHLHRAAHRDFLDMAITYAVMLEDGTQVGLAEISWEMLENWNVSEETLFQQAGLNTKVLLGERMTCFKDLICLPEQAEALGNMMYLLSNMKAYFGASAMLYSDGVRALAQLWESDLYILPASVHEVVVMPRRDADLPRVRETVRAVNASERKKEDVLTGSVYIYSRLRGDLRIAS